MSRDYCMLTIILRHESDWHDRIQKQAPESARRIPDPFPPWGWTRLIDYNIWHRYMYYRLRKLDWKSLTWAIECVRSLRIRVIVCDQRRPVIASCTVRHHWWIYSPCMVWPCVQTYQYLNLAHLFFSEWKVHWQMGRWPVWISPVMWCRRLVRRIL